MTSISKTMKKNTLTLGIFAALLSIGTTQALTISRNTMWDLGSGFDVAHRATLTMSTNKASYAPGETITITTSGSIDYDAGALSGYGVVSAQQMDITNTGVPPYLGYINSGDIDNTSMPYSIPSNDVFFPISGGTAPGTYNLDVRMVTYSKNSSHVEYTNSGFNHASLPYTVVAPVTVNVHF
jgi:hypothetical protein